MGVLPFFQKLGIKQSRLRSVRIRCTSRHRLVAIDGLHCGNIADVLKAGVDSVSVVSAICSAPDPLHAAQEDHFVLEGCQP